MERAHKKKKRDVVNLKFKSLHWLMGRNSSLSLENKLLIYNAIIKPIWTYGIEIWSTAAKSNMMCLQRIQNNILRTLLNAPWYTRNDEIHEYLDVPTIASEADKFKTHYVKRISCHPNPLMTELLVHQAQAPHRLKRRDVL
jgi:hypothetical protein